MIELAVPRTTSVCAVDAIPLEGGVAALVEGHPVAIFRIHSGEVFAMTSSFGDWSSSTK